MLTSGDADYMLRQFEAQIDEQLAQADRLRTRMESVQASHETRDGAIAVTVDSTGGLSGLWLSDGAVRMNPDELAAEILACSKRAQAKLASQMSEAMGGVLGSNSETAEFVTQTFTERFGSVQDDDENERDRRDQGRPGDLWTGPR